MDKFKKYYLIIFLIVPIMFIILGLLKFEIGKEAYFYTLSTIAQSLAALIAIIGAFVIFRSDDLRTQRKDYLNHLRQEVRRFVNSDINMKDLKFDFEKLYYILMDSKSSMDKSDEIFWNNICPFNKEINKIKDITKTDKLTTYNIKEIYNIIDNINNIDTKSQQIHLGFIQPVQFGLIAIAISILILPFGWIGIPYAYDKGTSYVSLKMFLIGIIIYLAILSIFKIGLFLYEISNQYIIRLK